MFQFLFNNFSFNLRDMFILQTCVNFTLALQVSIVLRFIDCQAFNHVYHLIFLMTAQELVILISYMGY